MLRKIIHIDESKYDGCGLCAQACHEGAIGMVNGKAKLLRGLLRRPGGLPAGMPPGRHYLCGARSRDL